MSKTRHEKSFVDYDKPYEQNLIGLRGIIYFAIGLFLLIVITFGLMFALLNVMEDQAKESKDQANPLMMTDRERLPPEPRLQAAPGFGVDSERGRVNPRTARAAVGILGVREQWEDQLKNGQRHPQTGAVITMPVDRAKEAFLQQSGQNGGESNGERRRRQTNGIENVYFRFEFGTSFERKKKID
jgi:hypothetical protein